MKWFCVIGPSHVSEFFTGLDSQKNRYRYHCSSLPVAGSDGKAASYRVPARYFQHRRVVAGVCVASTKTWHATFSVSLFGRSVNESKCGWYQQPKWRIYSRFRIPRKLRFPYAKYSLYARMHKDHSLLEIFSEPPSIYRGECYLTTGLCSNALAFANASANAAFALAFDSLWRLHLHLYLHLIHPHLHLHLIQMHLIESNSNQMPLYYYCFMMVISLLGFFWNKPEEDQYKNLWLQCLKVTMHT